MPTSLTGEAETSMSMVCRAYFVAFKNLMSTTHSKTYCIYNILEVIDVSSFAFSQLAPHNMLGRVTSLVNATQQVIITISVVVLTTICTTRKHRLPNTNTNDVGKTQMMIQLTKILALFSN